MATGKSREGDGGDDPKSEDLLESDPPLLMRLTSYEVGGCFLLCKRCSFVAVPFFLSAIPLTLSC